MALLVKEENGFKYVDEGQGQVLMLLHGLFGALSNWECVVNRFSTHLRVVIPMLPIYEMPIKEAGLGGLQKFVEDFVSTMKLDKMILMGNSLGGHVGILYTLANSSKVDKLVLTGSSGLFENGMGDSYPKRGDYEYIKKKTELTFYDPKTATKELVDEVYSITNNRMKAIKIIALAKSAIRNNLGEELNQIKQPTLLVWGNNDTITPPFVAREFNKLIPNSELFFVDKCGHAPMMEVPDEFNAILHKFLKKLNELATVA